MKETSARATSFSNRGTKQPPPRCETNPRSFAVYLRWALTRVIIAKSVTIALTR